MLLLLLLALLPELLGASSAGGTRARCRRGRAVTEEVGNGLGPEHGVGLDQLDQVLGLADPPQQAVGVSVGLDSVAQAGVDVADEGLRHVALQLLQLRVEAVDLLLELRQAGGEGRDDLRPRLDDGDERGGLLGLLGQVTGDEKQGAADDHEVVGLHLGHVPRRDARVVAELGDERLLCVGKGVGAGLGHGHGISPVR
jgi:hypothetical protein